MAKKRIDHVRNEIYGAHLKGGSPGIDMGKGATREALIERMITRVLTEMSITRFKWSGLPKEINERFLERELFVRSHALFWHEEGLYNKYFVTRSTANGRLNHYDEPTSYQTFGLGLKNRRVYPGIDCVPIWGNFLREPDLDIVRIYSHRLANFDRTIEINGRNARSPRIIATTENSRLTADNVSKAIEDGVQSIQLNGDVFNPDMITTLDMGMHPDQIEKLSIVKGRIWSECMGLLGIDNANQDKKERLVTDEVDANGEQVKVSRNTNLATRQEAAEQINSLFGLNVSVEYRVELDAKSVAKEEAELEVQTNGNVHDGASTGE